MSGSLEPFLKTSCLSAQINATTLVHVAQTYNRIKEDDLQMNTLKENSDGCITEGI